MQVRDVDATYVVASRTGQLVGSIVGSQVLGAQIINSILLPGERPTERNIQGRLRRALDSGTIRVSGVGPVKLQRLQSALQLGRALFVDTPETGTVVDGPSVVAKALNMIAFEPIEKFAVLALDSQHKIVSTKVTSSGTATETIAHPREIFGWVLQAGGVHCVLGHNHPSGSLEPSEEDLQLTRQLIAGGKLLDMPVLDHIIVSGNGHTSIRQHSCLWQESDS